MGSRPKRDGYIVRAALEEVDVEVVILNRALEKLLLNEALESRERTIGMALIAVNRISAANLKVKKVISHDHSD